jgi:hypothetical protein
LATHARKLFNAFTPKWRESENMSRILWGVSMNNEDRLLSQLSPASGVGAAAMSPRYPTDKTPAFGLKNYNRRRKMVDRRYGGNHVH